MYDAALLIFVISLAIKITGDASLISSKRSIWCSVTVAFLGIIVNSKDSK